MYFIKNVNCFRQIHILEIWKILEQFQIASIDESCATSFFLLIHKFSLSFFPDILDDKLKLNNS